MALVPEAQLWMTGGAPCAVREVGCFLPKQRRSFHMLPHRRLPVVSVESGSGRCIQQDFGRPIRLCGTRKSCNTRFFTVLKCSCIMGFSGRQNAATRRSTRREERGTVQGPVKKPQPDRMSRGGGGGGLTPPPPPMCLSAPKTVQSAEGEEGKAKRERIGLIVVVRSPCPENYVSKLNVTEGSTK